MKHSPLRAIPSVEKLLQALDDAFALPRPVIVAQVRRELTRLRRTRQVPDFDTVLEGLRHSLAELAHSRLQPVINATGVLVHTNLGRAPLPPAALASLAANARYNNLEFDLVSGSRGGRAAYLEQLLALLCGAEAATVVNNCAAALVLILRHFLRPPREEVLISRGELVQIGGGFRIPEILEASGARLREVGTTNRTALRDYTQAIGPKTALLLKVHQSNFFMSGFTAAPATEELAQLARRKRVPLVEDLGSGAVVATEKLAPVEHEPTPGELLKRGVDLVCCSGDKLLGGPQAGLIAGRARLVAALKKEPFYRALRCDKLTLSALQATAELYLAGQAEAHVPVLAMLCQEEKHLRERAERIVGALGNVPARIRVGANAAQIGGGTLPRSTLPSVAIEVTPTALRLAELAARLRHGTPPVISVLSGGALKLDLRTVFPEQDELLLSCLKATLSS